MGVSYGTMYWEFVTNQRRTRKRGTTYFRDNIFMESGDIIAIRGDFGKTRVLVDNLLPSTASRRADDMLKQCNSRCVPMSFDLLKKANIDVFSVNVIDWELEEYADFCKCGKRSRLNWGVGWEHSDRTQACNPGLNLRMFGDNKRQLNYRMNHYYADVYPVFLPTTVLFEANGLFYLFGKDTNCYSPFTSVWRWLSVPYLCELPKPSHFVKHAKATLVPEEVTSVDDFTDVFRQGDLFFVADDVTVRDIPGRIQKKATFGRHTVSQGKTDGKNWWVRGSVTHHSPHHYNVLRLGWNTLYRVYNNLAVRRWKIL